MLDADLPCLEQVILRGRTQRPAMDRVEEDAHVARLRGVRSGVLEHRARLVRFVVSERDHVCSA